MVLLLLPSEGWHIAVIQRLLSQLRQRIDPPEAGSAIA